MFKGHTMTTHLSARLAWHDRGWDGRVCDSPHLNSSCVVHQHIPDFTVSSEGDVFYWEHLGMLSVPSYRESWKRKKAWYEANGFTPQLITFEDGPDGRIDAPEIERTARRRILGA
jgi:hypothetical protein